MSQFLLIHGAFHGAWCWHKAIPELEKHGHRAQAIDLPGQGQDQTPLGNVTLDTMVDRIVTALTTLAGPVVLVGHSLAGMVISATAEKAPDRIKTLVFLSAFLPRDGESLLAMEHRNPKAAVPKRMIVDADHISATIMLDKGPRTLLSRLHRCRCRLCKCAPASTGARGSIDPGSCDARTVRSHPTSLCRMYRRSRARH